MNLNHESRASAVVITSVIFTVVSTIAVGVRLVARVLLLKNAGRDELAIIGSLLLSIGFSAITIIQTKHGVGKHVTEAGFPEVQQMLKLVWIAIPFYTTSLALTKIAIVSQYMRLFIGTGIRRACWATLALIVAYFLAGIFFGLFACVPVSAFWTNDPTAYCLNSSFVWAFNTALNIFTDIVVILLPMPALSTLKLPRKQKIGLMMLFGLGGVVWLVSILRLQSLYVLSKSHDPTWNYAKVAIWGVIEVNIAIVCASLPAIKPVVSCLFPRLLSSSASRQHGTPRYYSRSRDTYPLSSHNKEEVELQGVVTRPAKAVMRVEATKITARGESRIGGVDAALDDKASKENIFVTTEITQDVDSGNKAVSQENLILQRN